jgi:hypothetical protein
MSKFLKLGVLKNGVDLLQLADVDGKASCHFLITDKIKGTAKLIFEINIKEGVHIVNESDVKPTEEQNYMSIVDNTSNEISILHKENVCITCTEKGDNAEINITLLLSGKTPGTLG